MSREKRGAGWLLGELVECGYNFTKAIGRAMKEPCRHLRTRLIAKDESAEYVECMDCNAIFESEELNEPPLFEEDLSDA